MRFIRGSLSLLAFLGMVCGGSVYAEVICLKNGDTITGVVVSESKSSVSVKTEAMGTVSVGKRFIKEIISADKEASKIKERTKEVVWKREITAGYDTSRGNTRSENFSAGVFINRNKKHVDEITAKGNVYYASTNRRMDTQKWYALGRYAFSFGRTKRWYNFYKVEGDHDRFANIYYRIIPASGIGYWFYDIPGLKLMAETAAGLEHTDYYDETKTSDEFVLIPRGFFEVKLYEFLIFSQNVLLYPIVRDLRSYRIHSETALTVSLREALALRLSLVDDYNSKPPDGTKKNDLKFISSFVYTF